MGRGAGPEQAFGSGGGAVYTSIDPWYFLEAPGSWDWGPDPGQAFGSGGGAVFILIDLRHF